MEDLKPILYVLAAVAYFVYSFWRKAFKDNPEVKPPDELPEQNRRPVASRPQPQQPHGPPTSFEDILRELQPKLDKAKEQGRTSIDTAKEKAKPVVFPSAPARSYEATKPAERSLEAPLELIEARRKAEEARRTADRLAARAAASAIPVAPVPQEPASKHRIAAMLRNPKTVRDAVILSEVLQRKQF
ncbi:hypothetical protein FVR03_09020 [Pontibacter qinzhouensis]|uniref:Uncharacterized protein n=1 Tax=Pontibacter qinzhouensis TaxID=2603253 RepID=A0A5C8K6Z0_9BACT|nr:hypothetical protein [Pontibacter qinzhouensis]TXK47676.1 hypothetical protein FVR03_09020 [Pontibacter qinzhouensis]